MKKEIKDSNAIIEDIKSDNDMKEMANSQNLYNVGTMDGRMRWMGSSLERLT